MTRYTLNELDALGRVFKMAQEAVASEEKQKAPKEEFSAAYPSYSRSLVSQLHEDPAAAGRKRMVSMGVLGAILGALGTRAVTDKPGLVAAGGLGGGLLGAIPGYQSGKAEAQSENSRRLFLRRLGISRPGELEALVRNYPEASKIVLEEGNAI